MNNDDVRDAALGTLACWLEGYTDPLADGRQRRLRLLDNEPGDEECVTFLIEDYGGYDADRVVRVRVAVDELA